MLIQHIGHAEFLIEMENGIKIVTDPYDVSCGYPLHRITADIALVSHHHHDHDAVENLQGNPVIIDSAGSYVPAADIRITAVNGWHDDAAGSKRGKTLLFLAETEGLRIVHLGDLGCQLNEEQLDILRDPDVLMIPVGGFFTIDAEQAKNTAVQLGAKVILPMHYKTEYNSDWPISGPEVFLEMFEGKDICRDAEALRITKEDLECQPKVVLFQQEP